MPFVNRVKFVREIREMTQDQLAKELGISRQTLSSIENNNSLPNIQLAIDLANALSCEIDYLFYYKR